MLATKKLPFCGMSRTDSPLNKLSIDTSAVSKNLYDALKALENGTTAVGVVGTTFVVEMDSENAGERYVCVILPDGTYKTTCAVKGGYQNMSKCEDAIYIMRIIAILCEHSMATIPVSQWEAAGGTDVVIRDALVDLTQQLQVLLDAYNIGSNINLKPANIDDGTYAPETVYNGTFTILANGSNGTAVRKSTMKASSFNGSFADNRELTPEELLMVPVLDDTYILGDAEQEVAEEVSKSKPTELRNFMFAGPSGTGKTEASKAVAAGLKRPYTTFVCDADTDRTSLFCRYTPTAERDGAKESFQFWKLINDEDMEMDPEGSFKMVTGADGTGKTADDVKRAIEVRKEEESRAKPAFTYVESEIVKAFRYGWVLEIQEPTTIKDAAVLTELNDVMTKVGKVRLPFTGEIFPRHPDCVVIYTTNLEYNGCRAMNQSVIDRVDGTYFFDDISETQLAERAYVQTELKDRDLLNKMAKVVAGITTNLRDCGDDTGVCGLRSMLAWARKTHIHGDPYAAAMTAVIGKCSTDRQTREEMKAVVETAFKSA